MASTAKSTEPAGAVATCLGRWLGPVDPVVAALSGGMDSVVLLHLLRRQLPPGRLAAIHVNHGLSAHAPQWERFCRQLCRDWEVPLTVRRVRVDRQSGAGLEASARNARYEAFAKLPRAWICLAHHQDDQAETLVFNLLRGTGLAGAAAMAERRDRFLRPLLSLPRQRLLAYAQAHDLEWVEDESNEDIRFQRNFLRREILPRLAGRFSQGSPNLAAAAARFGEARDLLNQLAVIDAGASPLTFPFPVTRFRTLPEARARNLLRALLAAAGAGIPSEDRLVEAVRQFQSAAADRHPAIGFGGRVLRRRKGMLVLD